MLTELITQIIAICAINGHYDTPETVLLSAEVQAKCQAYYARCMREKYGSMEWDHLQNCIAERKYDTKRAGK